MKKIGLLLAAIATAVLLVSFIVQLVSVEEAPAQDPDVPDTIDDADRGRALFLAKGCTACHRHDALNEQTEQLADGPNLSRYRPDPEFVRLWLSDPPAVRPDTWMPDLNLDGDEIRALIAFLDKSGG